MTDETTKCDLCEKTDVSEPFVHRFKRGITDVAVCAHCLKECAAQCGVYETSRRERTAQSEGDL
jgi:hypothetical protein